MRTLEEANFRQVPVNDLKKVSRAIAILQQRNARLENALKHMHVFFEHKYKLKLIRLQGALDHKKQQIAELEEDNQSEFLFVVRQHNHIYLLEDFGKVNELLSNGGGRVVLCRLTKTLAIERALCIALAKSKCSDQIVVDDYKIKFVTKVEANKFEDALRGMLK